VSPTIDDSPPVELEQVQAGRLPPRYGYRMQDVLLERLQPLLTPGVRVLDVGAGRSPTIAPENRPPGCTYVGLDISEHELACADSLAYDRTVVHDITQPNSELRDFDVIISWQVLEHVSPLVGALANLRSMLRPDGVLLAQLSGSFAAFALAARVVPHRIRVRVMSRYLGHPEEIKFPTRFDRCYARALERMLADWSSVEILPFYRGATYLSMSRTLQRAYLLYEGALARRDVRDLATHYLLIARR
jgi:SAM-dependent methyltransferase